MAYELINEELNVWSCCIADLTMEQVNSFLSQWEPGAKIGTLTVFSEKIGEYDCRLVINRNNKNFELYKDLCCQFLRSEEIQRDELAEQCPESLHETLSVLFGYIGLRDDLKALELIEKSRKSGCIPDSYDMTVGLMTMMHKMDDYRNITSAFRYGFIQGKRCERERRRKKHDRSDQ